MERKNYREMLGFLTEQGFPLLMTKKDAASSLNISFNTLQKLVNAKKIKVDNGFVTIGSLANYLCGG